MNQTIPWMSAPAGAEAAESRPAYGDHRPERTERAPEHRRDRQPQQRRPHKDAARVPPPRPRPQAQPPRDHSDEPDGSHLPAFLLRPVFLKA
jgi:hypothetical protein